MMEGIRVHRVPLYPSHDKSAFRRIINYLSFALSSATIGPFLVRKPDVVYVYNLPTLGIAAYLLQFAYGCPVVYDIQDLWPDSVGVSGMLDRSLCLRILNYWCRTVYRAASHLVVLSPGMKAELLLRLGLSEDRVSVIYNWCDEKQVHSLQRDEELAAKLNLNGDIVVMFAGTMGIVQGLESVLKAAELVSMQQPTIKFVFIGGGVERDRLRYLASARGLSNVKFLEQQPPEAIGAILALADVLLVHLKDTPLFRMTLPSKIQAYMAAGKPILLGLRGDAAEIIQSSGAGEVVEPENPSAIAEAVLKFARVSPAERELMGMKGWRYYQDHMSMHSGIGAFEEIFGWLVCSENHRKSCLNR